MTAFCERTDILTNIQMEAADVAEALTTKAIVKGDAEVRAAFSVDMLNAIDAASPLPDIIKSLAEDIASYFVMRGLYAGNTPSINDWIDRYKEAKETLKSIANGTTQIEGITVEVNEIQSTTKGYKPTFDERDEIHWDIDVDKLADLNDADDC